MTSILEPLAEHLLGTPCESKDSEVACINPEFEYTYDNCPTWFGLEEDEDLVEVYVPFDYNHQPPMGKWADSSEDCYGYTDVEFEEVFISYKGQWYSYDWCKDPLKLYDFLVDEIKEQIGELE